MSYAKTKILMPLALLAAACSSTPEPLELTIIATDIAYDTSSISAQVGQAVNIDFVNNGALEHNFLIDAFGLDNLLVSGENASISFTPQEPGTYEFYCNVAGHLEAGMKGSLTVTE
jgi:plastocyanin